MRKRKETLLAREIRFLGLKQKEFADVIGATESTVSKWVTGDLLISPVMFAKMKERGIEYNWVSAPRDSSYMGIIFFEIDADDWEYDGANIKSESQGFYGRDSYDWQDRFYDFK